MWCLMTGLPAARMLPGLRAHVDDVVGHQPVPAHHQVQGDLALADAALAQQQDAHAEHVHQHAVDAGGRRERLLQEALHLLDGDWRAAASSSAPAQPLARLRSTPGSSRPLVTTTQARSALKNASTDLALPSSESVPGRDLRLAEDLDPVGVHWCSVKPVSASPGFWMRWIVMRRPRPDSPASSTRRSSALSSSSDRTVSVGVMWATCITTKVGLPPRRPRRLPSSVAGASDLASADVCARDLSQLTRVEAEARGRHGRPRPEPEAPKSVFRVLLDDHRGTSPRRRARRGGACGSRRPGTAATDRASAFRCTPVELAGATSMNTRLVGLPSIDSNSMPSTARPSAPTRRADRIELAVRDGDAVADRRGRQLFALFEHPAQRLRFHARNHLGAGAPTAPSTPRLCLGLQRRDDAVGGKEVDDSHGALVA